MDHQHTGCPHATGYHNLCVSCSKRGRLQRHGQCVGNIAVYGDTVTLTYRVKATQEGVHFNTAEVSKTNEKDKDSTPGNGNESDIDRQCFTVPVKLCTGVKVLIGVPAHLTNVQ